MRSIDCDARREFGEISLDRGRQPNRIGRFIHGLIDKVRTAIKVLTPLLVLGGGAQSALADEAEPSSESVTAGWRFILEGGVISPVFDRGISWDGVAGDSFFKPLAGYLSLGGRFDNWGNGGPLDFRLTLGYKGVAQPVPKSDRDLATNPDKKLDGHMFSGTLGVRKGLVGELGDTRIEAGADIHVGAGFTHVDGAKNVAVRKSDAQVLSAPELNTVSFVGGVCGDVSTRVKSGKPSVDLVVQGCADMVNPIQPVAGDEMQGMVLSGSVGAGVRMEF